jgi:hypothetical protein
MAPKLIAAIVTLIVNVSAGVALFFFLLVALNGYHENDAIYGLGVFAVLAAVITIATTVTAFITTGQMIRNNFRGANAALLATLVFAILGAVLIIFCGIVAVGVTHYVSVNY